MSAFLDHPVRPSLTPPHHHHRHHVMAHFVASYTPPVFSDVSYCICTGTSAGFWLGGSVPPFCLRRRKLWKIDYTKWCILKYNVYGIWINMCGQHIAVLYTCLPRLLSKYNVENRSFCVFSLFNFSSIFPGGQLTPFAPMCGRPWARAWQCRQDSRA